MITKIEFVLNCKWVMCVRLGWYMQQLSSLYNYSSIQPSLQAQQNHLELEGDGEFEQHIAIIKNPKSRIGSFSNFAFPELHTRVSQPKWMK